jgi:hypothetical protein
MYSTKKSVVFVLWLFMMSSVWSQNPAIAAFVARPNGFLPVVIEQPAGRVVIIVVNRSHQKLTTFQLNNSATKATAHNFAVAPVALEGSQAEWQETVTLAAGTYTLTETTNPAFKATLIIK